MRLALVLGDVDRRRDALVADLDVEDLEPLAQGEGEVVGRLGAAQLGVEGRAAGQPYAQHPILARQHAALAGEALERAVRSARRARACRRPRRGRRAPVPASGRARAGGTGSRVRRGRTRRRGRPSAPVSPKCRPCRQPAYQAGGSPTRRRGVHVAERPVVVPRPGQVGGGARRVAVVLALVAVHLAVDEADHRHVGGDRRGRWRPGCRARAATRARRRSTMPASSPSARRSSIERGYAIADQVEPRRRPADAVERAGAAARVVVARHRDHGDAGPWPRPGDLGQPQLGRDAHEVAVEQVAGQQQRVGLTVDGQRHQALDGGPRRLLDPLAHLAREGARRGVEMAVGCVNDAEGTPRTDRPTPEGPRYPGRVRSPARWHREVSVREGRSTARECACASVGSRSSPRSWRRSSTDGHEVLVEAGAGAAPRYSDAATPRPVRWCCPMRRPCPPAAEMPRQGRLAERRRARAAALGPGRDRLPQPARRPGRHGRAGGHRRDRPSRSSSSAHHARAVRWTRCRPGHGGGVPRRAVRRLDAAAASSRC